MSFISRLRLCGLPLSLLALSLSTGGALAQSADRGQNRLTDRLIVKYRDGTGLASLSDGKRLTGLVVKGRKYNRSGAELWRLERYLSQTEAAQVAAQVARQDPNVLYAEPDLMMVPTVVLNDTRAAEQWDLYDDATGIRAPAAWDQTNGSGVTVAVLDTGYLPHADLAANVVGRLRLYF